MSDDIDILDTPAPGGDDYARIDNLNPFCDINLDGFELRFQAPGYSPVTVVLPDQPLASNSSIYVAEQPKQGDLPIGQNVAYSPNIGGYVTLCKGQCSGANGASIFDALVWKGYSNFYVVSLPQPATFTSTINIPGNFPQNAQSFIRDGYKGAPPSFVDSDWKIAAATY